MDQQKKSIGHASGIIAALFIAPLIVFAVVYNSRERDNNFSPGSVNIKVQEAFEDKEIQGETLETNLKWNTENQTSYKADKLVKICDTREYAGEALRVCFIPMWFDKDERGDSANVCGVFNFRTLEQNDNKLVYKDGTKEITLNLDSGWYTNGWDYREDGCFYYTGKLGQNDLTATLLENVQLNEDAYALTADYVFRLDVLADAIQITDDAAGTRQWATTAAPQQSP